MRWPGWCCTSGEHGRDGTSETVEKIGSNANEFFKAQKSNCKSPAAPQCCERLLQITRVWCPVVLIVLNGRHVGDTCCGPIR